LLLYHIFKIFTPCHLFFMYGCGRLLFREILSSSPPRALGWKCLAILACHGNVSIIASLYHAVLGDREVLAMVGGGLHVRMYGGVWLTLLRGGLVGNMPPLDSPLCTFPGGPKLILDAFSLLPPLWREYCDSHPCPPLDNLKSQSRDSEFMLLSRLG
jgi:hypothetical protein